MFSGKRKKNLRKFLMPKIDSFGPFHFFSSFFLSGRGGGRGRRPREREKENKKKHVFLFSLSSSAVVSRSPPCAQSSAGRPRRHLCLSQSGEPKGFSRKALSGCRIKKKHVAELASCRACEREQKKIANNHPPPSDTRSCRCLGTPLSSFGGDTM